MQEVKFQKGDVIYCEGDPGDAIYVIRSGSVEVSRKAEGRAVRLAVFGRGEIFGETGVIQDKPRSTTMTALEPVSVLMVSKENFLKTFGEDNPIGLPLLRMLCDRLAKADDRMLGVDSVERDKVVVKRLQSLRILPASDFIQKQIGEDGAPIREFPFHVGRRAIKDQAPSVEPGALSLHASNDHSLSPEHFAIEKRDGGLVLRDLGSYLGTIMNGKNLSRFGHDATAPVYFGVNEVIAGTKESNYRFRILAEPIKPGDVRI